MKKYTTLQSILKYIQKRYTSAELLRYDPDTKTNVFRIHNGYLRVNIATDRFQVIKYDNADTMAIAAYSVMR